MPGSLRSMLEPVGERSYRRCRWLAVGSLVFALTIALSIGPDGCREMARLEVEA
jgi:hypothetical protein